MSNDKEVVDEESKDDCKIDDDTELTTNEMTKARAFLRERYLRFISGIIGKNADFHLYENSKVSGEFRGCDVNCLEIYVKNLETPMGNIPESILRATDVISFNINNLQ